MDDAARTSPPPPGAEEINLAAKHPRPRFPPSSILFFALSLVLALLAVLLATGTIGTSTPPPPPPTPGRLHQVDVVNALRARGLAAEIDPRSVRGAFRQPGLGIVVENETLYAFFFDSPAEAAEEFAAVDPADVLPPERGQGSPEAVGAVPAGATAGDPLLVQGSNVVIAMPGGDEETRTKVRAAIEGLP
jgi:hypothetical protein